MFGAQFGFEMVDDVLRFLETESAELTQLFDRLNFPPRIQRISKILSLLGCELRRHDYSSRALRKRSQSIAAAQPMPAAVTAWR